MGYTGMGMVSKILNLCYTIPIPMVSQVFMGSTLKCSSAAEDEPFLLQTWNLSVLTVLYDNSHSKWFSHLCSVVLLLLLKNLKCSILATDQQFLSQTWNTPTCIFTGWMESSDY